MTTAGPPRVAAPAGTRAAGAALLVAGIVLAAAIVWLVRLPGPADALAATVDPVVVPVTSTQDTVQRPVQVRVELDPATASYSPVDGGLVTAVLVGPGASVSTGTRLVEVAGVVRVGAWSRRPFYRALEVGDRGWDVDQLRSLLGQLGRAVPRQPLGHPYDTAMATAVRRWARSLGAGSDGSFDPSWVVWLPQPELVVASVQAHVGAPVPGPGQVLVSYRPIVRRATLVGPVVDAGPVVTDELTLAGSSATTHLRLADGAVVLDEPSRLRLSAAAAGASVGTGADAGPTAGAGADATSPGSVLIGAVRVTRWRQAVVSVPVTALLTRPDSSSCVVVSTSGGGWRPQSVLVLGSDPGTLLAEVTGLSAGASIVANPGAAGLAGRCRDPA